MMPMWEGDDHEDELEGVVIFVCWLILAAISLAVATVAFLWWWL